MASLNLLCLTVSQKTVAVKPANKLSLVHSNFHLNTFAVYKICYYSREPAEFFSRVNQSVSY